LIVADVSGHGESVSEFAVFLRGLMRKNINIKSQTRLVRRLNQQFSEMTQMRRFATALIATYLATNRQLTICNAGHPRPLLFRAAASQWSLMDEAMHTKGNLPLGLDDEMTYRQFAVELQPRDMILFYTDALSEAADSQGSMLGEEGLLRLAGEFSSDIPDRFGPALLDRVEQHRGGRPADDDTTLLVLHHNASGSKRLSLGEKVDVYAKVCGLKRY
jgi:serine phosphatase RsbU (regulator of sigma subunit)